MISSETPSLMLKMVNLCSLKPTQHFTLSRANKDLINSSRLIIPTDKDSSNRGSTSSNTSICTSSSTSSSNSSNFSSVESTNSFPDLIASADEERRKLIPENIFSENIISIQDFVKEIEDLHSIMEPRLTIYEAQKTNDKKKIFFTDENGDRKPASEALMPDTTILNGMNYFCFQIIQNFSPEASVELKNLIKNDKTFEKKVNNIKKAVVTAYSFFEEKMLKDIFSLKIDEKSGIALMAIKNKIYTQAGLKSDDILNLTQNNILSTQKKIDILQEVTYDYHIHETSKSARELECMPYQAQIVQGYNHLVKNEIELLKNAEFGSGFTQSDLKDKHVTFVGAGFPLSGILYNIHTGAKVMLIDYEEGACKNGEKVLNIFEKLGIIKKSDFEIKHGDVANFHYCKLSDNTSSDNSNNVLSDDKEIIHTDILMLASALPATLQDNVMKDESSDIPLIIKREKSTKMLYEDFGETQCGNFELKLLQTPKVRADAKIFPDEIPVIKSDYEDHRTTSGLWVKS